MSANDGTNAFIEAKKRELDAMRAEYANTMARYMGYASWEDVPKPTRWQRVRWWLNGWKCRFHDCWMVLRHGYEARDPGEW